ncbi:MAG TPA: hypothetical protein VED67_00800 [Thermodesulfovibrionales bacterium]|nr:hypothetical protein [Thermodesulfovibrionales bacterium]
MTSSRFEAILPRIHSFSSGRKRRNLGFTLALLFSLASIIAFTGCVSQSDYNALANNYNALQDENQRLVDTITHLQDDNSQLNATVADLQQQVNSAKSDLGTCTAKVQSYANTYGQVYTGVSPDLRIDVSGRTPDLVNNVNAHDPTWAELKFFLEGDRTDKETYDPLTHACGVFAEELYNNAEARGIKAAYVDIGLVGQEDHHAINAFRTTDYGLVYIDDTGAGYQAVAPGMEAPASYDKICFVHEGDPYECLGIEGVSPSCNSSCYTRATQDLNNYNAEVESYNSQLQAYNRDLTQYHQEVSSQTYTIDTPAWFQITAKEADLRQRGEALTSTENQLLEMKKGLVDVFDPLGTVGSIDIYW